MVALVEAKKAEELTGGLPFETVVEIQRTPPTPTSDPPKKACSLKMIK